MQENKAFTAAVWMVAALCLVAGAAIQTAPTTYAGEPEPPIWLNPVAQLIKMPIGLSNAGDGSGRLFINLHEGQIMIYDGTRLLDELFLDLSELVSCCTEQGLLGLAFHPSYEDNGRFFVNYTDHANRTVVAEYRVSDDPNRADSSSAKELFTIDRPGDSHNGGDMKFGPDGYLYIGVGDGTPTGRPVEQNPAQDLSSPSGKLLRIDVDAPAPYVPSSNPFAIHPDADGRVWASGLRNPWRLSFDRATGELFIGDVGASAWEEVNVQPAGQGGQNYGWPLLEGVRCVGGDPICTDGTATEPMLVESHEDGWCALIGGHRYRGSQIAELQGLYLYSDYCVARIMAAARTPAGWSASSLLETSFSVTSFGEDARGELYVNDLGNPLGATFRIESPYRTILTSPTASPESVQIQNPLGGDALALAAVRGPAGPSPAAAIDGQGHRMIVLGSPAGLAPSVTVVSASGERLSRWSPFPAGREVGVTVATGDLDGDGDLEVSASQAGGSGPSTKVYSIQGDLLSEVDPFPGFSGPVMLAVGDVTGDGRDELITSPGKGTTAVVKIFELRARSLVQIGQFLAYPDSFRGGAQVATGDIEPDGTAEIITLPGPGRATAVDVYRWEAERAERIRSWRIDSSGGQGGWLAAGNLGRPGGAASVVVSDARTARIDVFSGTGRKLSTFEPSGAAAPTMVAVVPAHTPDAGMTR